MLAVARAQTGGRLPVGLFKAPPADASGVMTKAEPQDARIARYRTLITQVSDERALKALHDLCEEMEERAQGAAAATEDLGDPDVGD